MVKFGRTFFAQIAVRCLSLSLFKRGLKKLLLHLVEFMLELLDPCNLVGRFFINKWLDIIFEIQFLLHHNGIPTDAFVKESVSSVRHLEDTLVYGVFTGERLH